MGACRQPVGSAFARSHLVCDNSATDRAKRACVQSSKAKSSGLAMSHALAIIALGSLVICVVTMFRLAFEKPIVRAPARAVPLPIIRPIQKKLRRFA